MNSNFYEFDINKSKVGEIITGIFLINSYREDVAKNKKKYLDVNLSNKHCMINCKHWDVTDEIVKDYANNKVIMIQGLVGEYQGNKQLTINKYKLSDEEVDLSMLILSSPQNPQIMMDYIYEVVNNFEDKELNVLVKYILDDVKNEFMYHGASKQHHHNYRSGLLEHEYTMLVNARKLVEQYKNNINPDLLYAACILHDIGKLKELKANEYGIISEYTLEGEMLGHIIIMLQELSKYVYILSNKGENISSKTVTLLSHLILSHHGKPEHGSPKFAMIKEAELLHYLDMLDTKMFMFDEILNTLDEDNDISKRQWALDNRKIIKC
jgi:3'-5' exoribonuclease